MMRRFTAFRLACMAPGLLTATALAQPPVVVVPPPATDPPQTSIEDTRERYRASRAADKPVAETPADVVEVGEGPPARQIEPADPALDPSSDYLAQPGAPRDATLLRPVLPTGFDRLQLEQPVREELLVIVSDYDRRIRAVLGEFSRAHSQAIGFEAAALAELQREGGPAIVEVPGEERTSGFRAGNARSVDRPAQVIASIPEDSPYAAASAESWKKLHALHLKAVRLQAEKLLALENQLSDDQLRLLRTYRTAPQSTLPTERQAIPARRTVPPQPGTQLEPDVEVDREIEVKRNEIEIEERRVTPDGERIEIETDLPR